MRPRGPLGMPLPSLVGHCQRRSACLRTPSPVAHTGDLDRAPFTVFSSFWAHSLLPPATFAESPSNELPRPGLGAVHVGAVRQPFFLHHHIPLGTDYALAVCRSVAGDLRGAREPGQLRQPLPRPWTASGPGPREGDPG